MHSDNLIDLHNAGLDVYRDIRHLNASDATVNQIPRPRISSGGRNRVDAKFRGRFFPGHGSFAMNDSSVFQLQLIGLDTRFSGDLLQKLFHRILRGTTR